MTESQLVTKMKAMSINDMILAGHVNDALQADRLLRRTGSDGVAITVQDDVVVLTGHVQLTTHITQVSRAIYQMDSMTQLENQLVADDGLAATVAFALGNHERTHGEQIIVKAHRGFIYLMGSVSSAAICCIASRIAASVSQVRGIINQIQAPDVVFDGAYEALLQPLIGQGIYTANDEFGNVRQVIINPHNRRVVAVVVDMCGITQAMLNALPSASNDMPLERRIVISIEELHRMPSGALFLTTRSDRVGAFVAFNKTTYIAPPADWRPPFPYVLSDVLLCRF
ncbi:MAG: BON domain-containing protein [Caldilineaceae bacterium]|nr:BON domain-containing protein [Caldilineaceae bacterium]